MTNDLDAAGTLQRMIRCQYENLISFCGDIHRLETEVNCVRLRRERRRFHLSLHICSDKDGNAK